MTKELFWRKAIARFTTSGLTKAQFCKKEGLSADLLRYWTETIAQRDEDGVQAGPPQSGATGRTFLPLVVAAEQSKSDRLPGTQQMVVAEIVFKDGSVLLFNGITKETVRALWLGTREGIE